MPLRPFLPDGESPMTKFAGTVSSEAIDPLDSSSPIEYRFPMSAPDIGLSEWIRIRIQYILK